jgi:sirohydrochlorin ferrochelatase
VLLIGRGSSDSAVKRDLSQIARLFEKKYPFANVDVCFLYGAKPSFEEALEKLGNNDYKQVFIIPYLLFTGILMNGIKKKIAQQSSDEQQIILCENLGYHNYIQDVLVERVNELLEKEKVVQAII